MKRKIKNLFLRKQKGQTLLIVIVISTLSMLLILGMADRIALSRVNIQRGAEFDRSIAIAENRVNDIIKAVDTTTVKLCLTNTVGPQDTTFKALACPEVTDTTLLTSRVYVRVSPDNSVSVTRDVPLTMLLSNTVESGISTSGIVAKCSPLSNANAKFMFTRIYLGTSGEILSDKGIATCGSFTNTSITSTGNVPLFSVTNGNITQVNGVTARANTLAVRVKAIDESNSNQSTLVELKIIGGVIGSPTVVATTGKYEFLVAGFGEFGSDSLVTFDRPLSSIDNYSPTLFDYVYLGEDF